MSTRDSEMAVIGACMTDPQAYWRVADMLSADDFSLPDYRLIWDAIAKFAREGQHGDFIALSEFLPNLSADMMLDLSNAPCSTSNVRGYAKWVSEAATSRRVIAAGKRISNLSGADVLAEAQRLIASCQPKAMAQVRSIRSFLQESQTLMQQRHDATEVLTGVPTSLDWLDEMTAGWQRSDLIIVAARPSVGKTAFAIQAAVHAARIGHPVFFASLEQSGCQVAERAIANVSGVSIQRIVQPKRIEEGEWPRITSANIELAQMPISIDETGALSVEAISARARQANAEKRLGLIVIDYLTQITPPRADKMADAIQMVTRALKALAKELSVPVMLLSQLNRDGEERPVLRNLRDSGAIEQDADVVIFLHRPDAQRRELIEMIIAKQRNGPCDSTYLHAAMEQMRFVTTDERPAAQRINARGFNTHAARTAA